VIAAAVASCDAPVVLIGRHWLTAAGPDGNRRRLADPDDFVRLEIEAALARDVLVIPVLVDGAWMPQPGELPPSLAALTARPPLELSQNRLDADITRLLLMLDQSLAQAQATQASAALGTPTVTAYRPQGLSQAAPLPAGPLPAGHLPAGHLPAGHLPAGQLPAGHSPAGHLLAGRFQAGQLPADPRQVGLPPTGPPPTGRPSAGPSAGPRSTRERPPRPHRRRTLVAALVACAAVAAGIAAFLAIPGSHPTPPSKQTPHRASIAKPASLASPAASKIIAADDFSTQRINWTDDAHQAAGAYTGTGAYRLSVTGRTGRASWPGRPARRTA
jgi:hypothetical protein